MTLTVKEKQEIIKNIGEDESDTGSSQVQVALLTERIRYLTEHCKTHKKDNHSRRGLLMLVNKRRKLLDYLNSKDADRYKALIKSLGLRK